MASTKTRPSVDVDEVVLPVVEFLADKRSLKPFAKRLGRPDGGLTLKEFLSFQRDRGIETSQRLLEIYRKVAEQYAIHGTREKVLRSMLDEAYDAVPELRELGGSRAQHKGVKP